MSKNFHSQRKYYISIVHKFAKSYSNEANKEVFLSNDFRFDIEDPEEYKAAIQNKIDEINSQLHITKLDFFKAFCKPVGITYAALTAKIKEVDMEADWELCNHIYYGVIKPFLQVLPLGKTEEEIIQIFEALCTKE